MVLNTMADDKVRTFLEEFRRSIRHRGSATRGLLATDHVILNHGQVTWTVPELAPPHLTTTPHQREDVSALDRFNVHRFPTRDYDVPTVTEICMVKYPRLENPNLLFSSYPAETDMTDEIPTPSLKPPQTITNAQIVIIATSNQM
ncbi:uncharacterized protein TNCV_4171111 [Trichonephila clavipes]|nr:uncharacterized protein TNCV_4171111 [Trichonephila clavipes]